MKTLSLRTALALIVLAMATDAQARIWRVNNLSNYNGTTQWGENYGGVANVNPVFKQINQVFAWAGNQFTAGDTIHVEASNIVYETADIPKRAVIIGAGYFLNENPNLSNTLYDTKISRINFNAGSANSQVMGMNVVVNGSSTHGYINITPTAHGVTIKRNRLERGVAFEGTAASHIEDVYILQNFFAVYSNGDGSVLHTNGSSSFYPPNDITFNNNICQNKLIWKNSTTTWTIRTCHNNVFDGQPNTLNLEFYSESFKNNILKANGISATINNGDYGDGSVSHNTVPLASVLAGSPGQVTVSNMTTLFVDATANTTDGDYQLLPNSANGTDGTQRGVFGGAVSNRYQLSGVAPIPVIYSTVTTGVSQSGTGLPVQIKAKTIK